MNFRETALIHEVGLDPTASKIDVMRLIAREMAHQCFNNFGNPFWWSTSWFNEGTAMLFAVDVISKVVLLKISLDPFHSRDLKKETLILISFNKL